MLADDDRSTVGLANIAEISLETSCSAPAALSALPNWVLRMLCSARINFRLFWKTGAGLLWCTNWCMLTATWAENNFSFWPMLYSPPCCVYARFVLYVAVAAFNFWRPGSSWLRLEYCNTDYISVSFHLPFLTFLHCSLHCEKTEKEEVSEEKGDEQPPEVPRSKKAVLLVLSSSSVCHPSPQEGPVLGSSFWQGSVDKDENRNKSGRGLWLESSHSCMVLLEITCVPPRLLT